MKNTLLKVWGIVLTLAILSGLLMASVPVAAADLAWSPLAAPVNVSVGGNLTLMAQTPDGKTVFAYNAGDNKVYSSTGGAVWAPVSAAPLAAALTITALAVSSNYAVDKTIVAGVTDTTAVTGGNFVYRSTNGGISFGPIPPATPLLNPIVSVAYGLDFTQVNNIAIAGTSSGTGLGQFWTWRDTSFTWTAAALGTIAAGDVLAVAFSPGFTNDTVIYTVVADHGLTTAVRISTLTTAGSTWVNGTPFVNAGGVVAIAVPAGADSASIGIDAVSGTVYVGLNDVGTAGDVYSGFTPTAMTATITAPGVFGDVTSVAVAGGKVYIGLSNGWARVGTGAAGGAAWTTATKNPAGINAKVAVLDTGDVVAITGGVAAGGAAYLAKGGVTNFNAVALISRSVAANIMLKDLVVVDANVWYLLVWDDQAVLPSVLGTEDAGDFYWVMKTADAGKTWMGIYGRAFPMILNITLSPAYATDNTVYLPITAGGLDTVAMLAKSANAGDSFGPPTNTTTTGGTGGKNLVAFAAKDGTTYYAAYASGAVFKGGRLAVSGSTASLPATDLKVASNGDILAGIATNVLVSVDDGATFKAVTFGLAPIAPAGVAPASAVPVGNIKVVPAADYATSKTLYALNSAAVLGDGGVWKFTTTSAGWSRLTGNTATTAVGPTTLGIGAGNELYANDVVVGGLARSLTGTSWSLAPAVLAAPKFMDFNMIGNTIYAISGGVSLATFTDIVLKPVTLGAPADKAVVAPANLVFNWTAYPGIGGAEYSLQLAYDSAFTNVLGTKTLNSTIYVFNSTDFGATLIPGQTYYYRIRLNANSVAPPPAGTVGSVFPSPYTAATAFTVTLASDVNPGLNAIGRMVPESGAIFSTGSPAFSWGSVSGASGYDFKLSGKPDFSDTIDSANGLTNTVFQSSATLKPGSYFWEVRAVAGTVAGAWVQSTFTIAAPVVLPSPTATTPPAPPVTPNVTVTVQPAPPQSQAPITVTIPPSPEPKTPSWAWIVIAIGAVLVIAVIVLIVRTRKV